MQLKGVHLGGSGNIKIVVEGKSRYAEDEYVPEKGVVIQGRRRTFIDEQLNNRCKSGREILFEHPGYMY